MDVFVARQPIFNKQKKLFAYELLFRTGMSNAFPNIDGGTATSSLLSSSFFTVGIDKISGGKRVFINFTEELLVAGTPTMFPADKIVVEVLEDVLPTEAVVAACQSLAKQGFSLALDDFVYHKQLAPLIDIAKIIKIDFRLTPLAEVEEIVTTLKKSKCQLLAEKIETYEEFQQALQMGFVYFQGYFFAKPEVLKNKDISSSQMTILQIINEVNRPEIDSRKLEALINQDVSISYKILNYLNSAYFARLQPISSIRQALTFLGENGVRLFVSLIATSKLAEHKPDELMRTSIIRARFLEHIGEEVKVNSSELFMLGLFSLLDAMLDNSLDYLVGQLPISPSISEALVKRSGKYFPYLQLLEYYEACEWNCLEKQMNDLGVSADHILDFYIDAVRMADVF